MLQTLRYTKTLPFCIGLLVGIVLCGVGVWFLPHTSAASADRGSILREHDPQYTLVSPLLAAEVGSETSFPELSSVKGAVGAVIAQAVAAGDAQDVSVYYRLLNSARWFEINGDTKYAPASLLKVFVMVAYYVESEHSGGEGLLEKRIRFEGSANPTADTPGEVIPHLVSGKYYTVEQVIDQMIRYSDNDALTTLTDNLDPGTLAALNQIFTDLKIPNPSNEGTKVTDFLSVEQYSLIFRVLFSTTYLTPADSQRALDLLSRAQYTLGLVAGVPPGIVVAHKFGDTTDPATATSPAMPELHDCGIVYYPDHPYLLCVMTRGSSFASLQALIQKISTTTYQQTLAHCPASTSTSCFPR